MNQEPSSKSGFKIAQFWFQNQLVLTIRPSSGSVFTNWNQNWWFEPTKPGRSPTLVNSLINFATFPKWTGFWRSITFRPCDSWLWDHVSWGDIKCYLFRTPIRSALLMSHSHHGNCSSSSKVKEQRKKSKVINGNHKTICWHCYESPKIRHHKKLINRWVQEQIEALCRSDNKRTRMRRLPSSFT